MKDFITGLTILSAYYDEGLDTKFFMEAEHECIFFQITDEQLPVDSPDGKKLDELGFSFDDDIGVWVKTT